MCRFVLVILVILVPHTCLSNLSSFSRFSLPHIPSGLNHGLVQRQRSTWEKVPSKHKKSMEVRRLGAHMLMGPSQRNTHSSSDGPSTQFSLATSSPSPHLLIHSPPHPHPLPPPTLPPPSLPFPGSSEFHESIPQHGQVQRTPEDHITAPHPLLPNHQEGPDIPI